MAESHVNIGTATGVVVNNGTSSSITNVTHAKEQTLNSAVSEIQVILEQLASSYPDAFVEEKQTLVKLELKRKFKQDPTLKDRLLNAFKSGGFEAVKAITNNPFVSIPLEMLKGLLEAEPKI